MTILDKALHLATTNRRGQAPNAVEHADPHLGSDWAPAWRAGTANETRMVVTSRDVEIPEHYRVHVTNKMAHLDRYDRGATGFEVTLSHEKNRRRAKLCQRVVIRAIGASPQLQVEGRGPDFYVALAAALTRLETRLRRRHDRRSHRAHRSVADHVTTAAGQLDPPPAPTSPTPGAAAERRDQLVSRGWFIADAACWCWYCNEMILPGQAIRYDVDEHAGATRGECCADQ